MIDMPYPVPNEQNMQLGPNSPFYQPGQVAPATPAPGYQGPAGIGEQPRAASGASGGQFSTQPYVEDNFYGGQQIAGSDPSMGEYGAVQNYADQAYEESRRYLDPQQESENARMAQTLINMGIDPNSAQGVSMMDQLGRQQADANNAATFGSLQFGQGIQNQMSQQELANQQLASQMQQALWANNTNLSGQDLQRYLGDQANATALAGQQNQYNLGMAGIQSNYDLTSTGMQNQYDLGLSAQDLQRYGMDLQNQIAQGGLDMQMQGQDFGQMLGLEGLDFRNQVYADSRSDYQDQLIMTMLGLNQTPGGTPLDPSGAFGQTLNSANNAGPFGGMFS